MHITVKKSTLCDTVLCLQGPLGVAVTYGGDHVPKSPFNVAVAPTVDLSKISVSGLGDSKHLCDPSKSQ